ncbi:two-component system, NtrC family, response regulator AtoC [Natronincola peptidivorans]|uniref:Stage 0 sporulation protein A homolog n=1 Tax=Natronincola peptidivorans TaxID=426128 RepID=A0A1H9ZM12_9FIRM|nr:sigma-54 dependent transcriptional regulator [Natronincola peptidivorans]SES82712.1 two-component system, NtrC family, response regulator AtoC [Natronincola peptidivorans]
MRKRILIVDDEEMIRLSLKEGLTDLGYQVSTAENGMKALGEMEDFKPQIIFLDMRLSGESGLELIPKIKEIDRDVEVVIMTAYGDIQTAVKAIKRGAFDYINKPFDLEEIDIIIRRIIKSLVLQKKVYLLEQEKKAQYEYMLGEDPSMQEVIDKIHILSSNDTVTVLIQGETGTGKELVASAIHNNSIRKDAPMVKINCGALPQQLVESELFGFEKNAFTGANTRKKGLLEVADGGTVFLDEIGEVSLNVQTKLLRFLEERKLKRVGGLEDIEVDIRIIAATNKNLEEAISKKEFREDLYYRLNVVPIYLPPLRERGRDILVLAEHYLQEFNKKFHKRIKGFTRDAEKGLLTYSWRGNVRELKNIIERSVLLGEGEEIDLKDLPFEAHKDSHQSLLGNIKSRGQQDLGKALPPNFSLEKEIQEIETQYILLALQYCNNNYSKASEMLGISRFALKRKIEKYDLE